MHTLRTKRSGMTMIELVSALMLFIFILGGLTMALNKASSLWSTSHTNQYEQEKADLILSMLGNDLQQAVTDNALVKETQSEAPPTFLSDATPLNNSGELRLLLQFIKHAPYRSVIRDEEPPALEAVLYTFYRNSLFRHVLPLGYSDPENPEHIGELLEDAAAQVNDTGLHDAIIAYKADPSSGAPSIDWEYSLLAENVMQPVVLSGIAPHHTDEAASELYNKSYELSNSLRTLPEYVKLETDVLPDYIFFALRIFNQEQWNEYDHLMASSNQETIARKEPYLGKFASRRYSFRTLKGARLK